MTPCDLSRIFALLSTERRLLILQCLMRCGEPVITSVVTSMTEIPPGETSSNLMRLYEIGLLNRHVSGRNALYEINREKINEIRAFFQ